MEALLVTFRREFHGVPYLVHCEDALVSDGDVAWLRGHVFDPSDPVVDLAPDEEGPPELFHSLYLDGNFMTEIVATLEPEARRDPAMLERHRWLQQSLAIAVPGAAPLWKEWRAEARRARRASSPPLVQGRA